MKKVNLDEEYDLWRKENEVELKEKFLEIHFFEAYLEEAWRDFQEEHDLYDKSNEEVK